MIYVSHAANVLILIAVCTAYLRDSAALNAAIGHDTVARRILGCLYFAILLASLYALLAAAVGSTDVAVGVAWVLFPLQIVYKLSTVWAVGLHNPVVRANVAVAALHAITLAATGWYP